MRDRLWRVPIRQTYTVFLQDHRQDQHYLDHRKHRPCTHARSHRKRQIGIARTGFAIFGAPACGIIAIRILLHAYVTMQVPRAKHNLTTRFHFTFTKLSGQVFWRTIIGTGE